MQNRFLPVKFTLGEAYNMRISILSAVLCLFIQFSLFSQEVPNIELKDTMWQFMPDDVISVFRGNDGRLWQQIQDDPPEKDIEKLKQNIQEEFSKKSPRIRWRIALFESGKRVWFTNKENNMLLGYDGEKWIEKKADEKHFFYGVTSNCFRKGKPFNIFLDGRSFFIDSLGILTFDGENWDYCKMADNNFGGTTSMYPILLPCPDMKGVFAVFKSKTKGVPGKIINAPAQIQQRAAITSGKFWTTEINIMEFRDGKWTNVELADGLNPADIEIVLPREKGMIVGTTGGKMIFFQDEVLDKEKFNALLAKLSDENFNVREKATTDLAGLGITFRKSITEARKEAKDPEVRDRLSKALELMKDVQATQEDLQVFGDYILKDPAIVHYDVSARIFLTSADVRMKGKDETLGPGLIILDADDKAIFLKGEKFTKGWDKNYQSGGALQPLPSIFWLETKDAIRMLDIEKKDFIYETKDLSFHWLHAASADGIFFCSRGIPFSPQAKPVAVFKPSAKDERIRIPTQEIKVHSALFIITADGSIWLKNPEGGVVMFNGKEWKNFPEIKDIQVTKTITGKDGALISVPSVSNQTELSFMYADGKLLVEKNIDLLISKNRKVIEKYFDVKNKDFLYDGAGNIWYQKGQNELMVSSVARTFNLYDKLQEAYSKGQVRSFMGIGRNKVLIDYYSWGHGGPGNTITLACQFKDGVPELKEIPRMSRSRSDPVYDNEGKLWYPLDSAPDEKQVAIRIGEEEKTEEIKDSGLPYICDKSGNVWLGNITGQPKNKFNIWRKGEIKASIEIPHANEWSTFTSNKEGSVIAFTGPLVTHLVAEDPANPATYKVKAEYWLDFKGTTAGSPDGFRLGDKFYLGFCSWMDKEYFLNIIEFPPAQNQNKLK